jgi:hypothetical protein
MDGDLDNPDNIPVANIVSNLQNNNVSIPLAHVFNPTSLNNNNTSNVLSATNVAQAVNPRGLNNNNSNMLLENLLPQNTQLTKIVTQNMESLTSVISEKNYTFYKPKYRYPRTKEVLIGYIDLGKFTHKDDTDKLFIFTKGSVSLIDKWTGGYSDLYYDPTSSGGNKRKSYRRRCVSSKRKSKKQKKSRKTRKSRK